MLIFISKADKKFIVVGDRASRAFFPPGTFKTIHDAMRASFQTGDFDQAITTGVNLVLAQYRSHKRSIAGRAPSAQPVATSHHDVEAFGTCAHLARMILLAGFLIIRAIFRAMSGRADAPGHGGRARAAPVRPRLRRRRYGPGYGGGMGGGGFFSGLLGGLGGAFIGNELFGGRGGGPSVGGGDGMAGLGGDPAPQNDECRLAVDAGQADMGNAGGGGWGRRRRLRRGRRWRIRRRRRRRWRRRLVSSRARLASSASTAAIRR